ncbi:hypothetical protein OF829_09830 [Sphingomonas sp. LB-2]|uniref:hypothetical protein n=1 Tax=Sphingomonas caeni TaxID=2984949 RepID=UPI00222F3DD4|nr:hypothetical protein [Sphingomonas caeni]MCW3847541.1 hypothetical protein [Sphingomonas caeni]
MAVYGFRGLGWFAVSLTVALGGYMVMSQGAAERARLHQLDVRIADAKRGIRNLETEFSTRANLAQLERWNANGEGGGLGMAAPAPQQFIAGETALADLDRVPDEGEAKIEQASLVVPTGAPRAQTETAALTSRDPAATAQAQPQSGARPMERAVAMVDRRQLLSSSTMGDLERSAASERQALR